MIKANVLLMEKHLNITISYFKKKGTDVLNISKMPATALHTTNNTTQDSYMLLLIYIILTLF